MVFPRSGDASGFSSQLPVNNEYPPLKRPRISDENQPDLNIPTTHPSCAPISRGSSNIYYKTQLCVGFEKGQCQNGEICNFAHGREDMRPNSRKWKELSYDDHKNCDSNDDRHAFPNKGWGDSARLRKNSAIRIATSGSKFCANNNLDANQEYVRSAYYKTRVCLLYRKTGFCSFGDKCCYAHGPAELQHHGGRNEGATRIPTSIPTNHVVHATSNIVPSNNMANVV